MISYPISGAYASVADEIVSTGQTPIGTLLYSETIYINVGYQSHSFPNTIFGPKGTMLRVTMLDGLLGINSYQMQYSDFNWLNLGITDLSAGNYALAVYVRGFKPELLTSNSINISPTYFRTIGSQIIKASFTCITDNVNANYTVDVVESE